MNEDVFAKQAEEYGIPEYMISGLYMYIENGYLPGSFLEAILSNDLVGAVSNADYINKELIPNYVKFLYNCAPMGCWSSKERVNAWIEGKRKEKALES